MPRLPAIQDRRKGQNPSLSSIYRALAEHEKAQAYPEAIEAAHADFAILQAADGIPGPRPARAAEQTVQTP
ncbi:hypothetical protein [Streptomyces tanashiensis]|uniref:hypothetical protein n=1 Tax=Streptomyces tanashiensis TaxID=67367 RepID=UPI0019BB88CA|nr:hypothetical protein [Streptomyces tanashiensis]GGY55270.1 hypothetical protein GCM10010299_71970 [Streptomyces tanashiensis]